MTVELLGFVEHHAMMPVDKNPYMYASILSVLSHFRLICLPNVFSSCSNVTDFFGPFEATTISGSINLVMCLGREILK
jgi:hypothetical protein